MCPQMMQGVTMSQAGTQGGHEQRQLRQLTEKICTHIVMNMHSKATFKRSDFRMLLAKYREIRVPPWNDLLETVGKQLRKICGYGLVVFKEDSAGTFCIVNGDNRDLSHLTFPAQDTINHGLLYTVLAVIFMHDERMTAVQLSHFLSALDIRSDGAGGGDQGLLGGGMSMDKLIKEWTRRGWLSVRNVQDEAENKEYVWGRRAQETLDKLDVVNFVAAVYGVQPKDFGDAFKRAERAEEQAE